MAKPDLGILKTIKSDRVKLLFQIFITFLGISPITFGGGFAMIPILEKEIVERKKWIDREEIIDIFAVAQSIPGAIAVNSSIFLGYRLAGAAGAFAAMLGIVLPTFLIIIILAVALVTLQDNHFFQAALRGIHPVIIGLIAYAAYKMGKVVLKDKTRWLLFLVTAIVLIVFKTLNPVFMILAGAISGMAIVKLRTIFQKIKGKSDTLKIGK